MKNVSDSRQDNASVAVPRSRDLNETSDARTRTASVRARASYVAGVVEGIAVIAAAVVVSLLLTWPLLTGFGDHIFGLGGDSTGGMAGFRQWAHETGFHIMGISHISSAGAPFGFDQGNGVNLQAAWAFFPA